MDAKRKPKDNKNKSALERLKQRREAGTRGLSAVQDTADDDDRIYDEVDEADYALIVRKRMQQEDFVVDDDGLGYADQGADDWDQRDGGGSETDDSDYEKSKKAKKSSASDKKSKKKAQNNHGQNIGALLAKQSRIAASKKASVVVGPSSLSSATGLKSAINNQPADVNLDDLLNQIDDASAEIRMANMGRKKKKNPYQAPDRGHVVKKSKGFHLVPRMASVKENAQEHYDNSNEYDASNDLNQDSVLEQSEPMRIDDESKEEPVVDEPGDEEIKLKVRAPKRVTAARKIQPSEVKMALAQPTQVNLSKPLHGAINPDNNDWWSAQQLIAPQASTQFNVQASYGSHALANKENFIQDDGSLLMYWLDACEGVNGIVYVFGKIYNKAENKFVSCCVSVKDMHRSVYFLPRQRVVDGAGKETDVEVDMQMVWEELDSIFSKNRIPSWEMQQVQRKYSFEVPDVPAEADWIEVNYPFTNVQLQNVTQGKTFNYVFGSGTNALELLLLRADLMGPGWIEIREPQLQAVNVSWCKTEATIQFSTLKKERLDQNDVYNIRPVSDSMLDSGLFPEYCRTAPTLTVMSMSMKTVMNYQKNINEVVIVSALVYHKVSIDGATSLEDQKLVSNYTAIRQLGDNAYPIDFADGIRKKNPKVEIAKNEKALLNYVMAMLHGCDPDIIVGHNFLGFDLDVLLHRMRDLNVDHWSRLGRVRRRHFPKLQAGVGGMGESTFAERQVTSGRLIGDTYLAAKDLIKSKSYSLAQLSKDCLHIERQELDFEKIPQFYSSTIDLIWLTQHCENDAYLSIRLAFHTMMIPLTKQLTNLAGNLWSRTMVGGRAERNEFLLLHEFYRNDYIVPDKTFAVQTAAPKAAITGKKTKKGAAAVKDASVPVKSAAETFEEDEDEDSENIQEVKKAGKRKPAYSGGLVLEPKKGFYDKYVLMLDFNSLYPSIIQEYNICFTTVERKAIIDPSVEEVPELPDSTLEQGILPRMLATLVQRRRAVKGLMKSVDTSSNEYAQLNIRQQALKLTANSMYGCLGFTHSRFYAKPIAILVTAKGREILQDTVTLAEQSLSLEVIYGDTDSIMIHTATDDLKVVKELGRKLKAAVNKKYKLLEIEMDGFFRRMLLLKKKKYAALTVTEGEGGKLIIARETKGLDLVRRDWCELSHEISGFVLDQILSDKEREDVLNNIHAYLSQMGTEIRGNKVDQDKFVINKSLTKAPEEYNDAKAQPHVQVALRMKARGKTARVGDTIQYVICKDAANAKSYALRAYHLDELNAEGSKLALDIDWYLNQQIHPPVARLCRPIEGTDDMRIATCLGLDASRFRGVTSANDDSGIQTFQCQISDEERFKTATRLEVTCAGCHELLKIEVVVRHQDKEYTSGLECSKCSTVVDTSVLVTQVILSVRAHIKKYYQRWMVCDEPSCALKTRQVSVNGRQCLAKFCRGTLLAEYSDGDLYSQLLYLQSLFDVERCKKKYASTDDKETIMTIINVNLAAYAECLSTVKAYLIHSARGYVDLKRMFSFVQPMPLTEQVVR